MKQNWKGRKGEAVGSRDRGEKEVRKKWGKKENGGESKERNKLF